MESVRNQIAALVLVHCEGIVHPEKLTGIVAVIPWMTFPGPLSIWPIDFSTYDLHWA
jgi:hypothetical protein